MGVMVFLAAVDSFYYGAVTFVPFNFIYYNIVLNYAALYGVQPIHWYFTNVRVVFLSFIDSATLTGTANNARSLRSSHSLRRSQSRYGEVSVRGRFKLSGF